jgi:hypothetical protein
MNNVISMEQYRKPKLSEANQLQKESYSEALSKKQYFEHILNLSLEAKAVNGNEVLGGMFNLKGLQSKEQRKLFLDFYENPSAETWAGIRLEFVDASFTAWQLWTDFDVKAPCNLIGEYAQNAHPSAQDFESYVEQHQLAQVENWKHEIEKANMILNMYR